MLTEKQFEDMMGHRYIEPPRPDLAERIIAAAREGRGYSAAGVITYLREAIESVLPRPSYALAAMLIIGVLIGASLPVPGVNETSAADDEESIL